MIGSFGVSKLEACVLGVIDFSFAVFIVLIGGKKIEMASLRFSYFSTKAGVDQAVIDEGADFR